MRFFFGSVVVGKLEMDCEVPGVGAWCACYGVDLSCWVLSGQEWGVHHKVCGWCGEQVWKNGCGKHGGRLLGQWRVLMRKYSYVAYGIAQVDSGMVWGPEVVYPWVCGHSELPWFVCVEEGCYHHGSLQERRRQWRRQHRKEGHNRVRLVVRRRDASRLVGDADLGNIVFSGG